MTDILSTLRRLSWRGIEALFTTDASYTFSHRQAPRAYPYIDVEGHDNIGRASSPISVTCYFMESLQAGSYVRDWPRFRAAIFDGSSDTLVHPDLGGINARVQGGSVTINAQGRSGVVVNVTFIETRDNADTPDNAQPPAPDAQEVAKAADADIAALRITYPDGLGAVDAALAQVPILYPDGTSEGGSVFDLINGVVSSFHSAGLALTGKVNQAAGLIDQMVGGIEDLDDPDAWPVIDNLIQAIASLRNSAEKVIAAERPRATKTVTADTTLDAFAELVGNTLEEVAGLNTFALFSPIVSKGTTLSYYVG